MNYANYLQTEYWLKKRSAALDRAGHRCQVCNGTYALEVHHRTYENLGNEQPDDLTVLCHDCHTLFTRRLPCWYSWLGHLAEEFIDGPVR